ncbi:MAG: hypothetical protein J0I06_16160 [Planctomycetes bacterium]|nr:hypothetical protein [Planctomycetota bacterium]
MLDRPAGAGAVVIVSPVALTPARGADLAVLDTTARTVAEHLGRGQLVVLTGPVPPGTTRDVLLPWLRTPDRVPGAISFSRTAPCRTRAIPGASSGDSTS